MDQNVLAIRAYLRRNLRDRSLLELSLKESCDKMEVQKFGEDDLFRLYLWWFNKAAVKENDFDQTEGSVFDLEAVVSRRVPPHNALT